MLKKLIIPVFVLSSLLMTTGCVQKKDYSVEEYGLSMEYKDNFKILQLTDIHFTASTNMNDQFTYLKKNITTSNPDLIVITGDSFFGASKVQVDLFFDFFDSLDVKYAIVNGNHDHQGSYGSYYVETKALNAKNSMFIDYQDDNLTGNMNYYIDLKDGEDLKYRLFLIDSNSYIHLSGLTYEYDIIHKDQMDHFKAIQESSKDKDFTTLAFFHIPLFEFQNAYDQYQEGKSEGVGEHNEKVNHGYKNEGQFDAFKEMGVKAMFCGHDHINDTTMTYEDVFLCYGVKSTNQIYHNEKMIGYKEIGLPSDGNLKFENITNHYVPYEKEVK